MVVRMLWQGAIIVIAATGIALFFNTTREERLSVVATWSEHRRDQEALEKLFISIEKAQALFPLKETLFLDARTRELYEQGHITGARNLPLDSFEAMSSTVLGDVPRSTPLIVYFEGTDSTPGIELALLLLSRNYRNVYVLERGWDLWTSELLPVEAVLFEDRQEK